MTCIIGGDDWTIYQRLPLPDGRLSFDVWEPTGWNYAEPSLSQAHRSLGETDDEYGDRLAAYSDAEWQTTVDALRETPPIW